MRKFASPLLCLAGYLSMNSQITLTGTSPMGYTANIAIASAATASNVPIGTTGNGVTWNCSSLQTGTNPIVTLEVAPPAGKPYASDYPQANRNQGVTYLTNILANEFQHLSADSLVKYGNHVSGSSYEIYDNPEIILKFPMSFGQTYVNNYSKTNYNAGGGVTSYQTGSNTITYDGFGTLILPSGTYSNVARIKNDRSNSLGPVTTSYMWLMASTGEILLQYGTNGGIKVNYLNSAPTGMTEHSKEMAGVYPNPSQGNFTVKSSRLIDAYKVYDVSGRLVQQDMNVKADAFSVSLDAPAGIYFLEIFSPGISSRMQKLVISK